MQQTKIVATLGPASDSTETICSLLEAGVDVFRLNFSHGTREEHAARIERIRAVSDELKTCVAIMQDLGGPKIRTGKMADGAVTLTCGAAVTIVTEEIEGSATRFGTSYRALARDVTAGSRILLDDGALELEAVRIGDNEVECRVLRGGLLHSRKGMNLPGSPISEPSVTAKDMADLEVGIDAGVDFVAISFVRSPDDVRQVRALLQERGSAAQVIAKIERPEAVARIEAIVEASHGILVARGDLGVEMDLASVPLLQKQIIRIANAREKYVIVATQMLESMVHSQRPTRAEVSDVTNAVLDGTDAVMLSAETSVGAYPVEAVRVMDRIARTAEEYETRSPSPPSWGPVNSANPVQDAVARAAFTLCRDLDAKTIGAFSATGGTALFLSKRRPPVPILAFTADEASYRRMCIFRGVIPVLDPAVTSKEQLAAATRLYAREHGLAHAGDALLMVAGTAFGQIASANGVEVVTC